MNRRKNQYEVWYDLINGDFPKKYCYILTASPQIAATNLHFATIIPLAQSRDRVEQWLRYTVWHEYAMYRKEEPKMASLTSELSQLGMIEPPDKSVNKSLPMCYTLKKSHPITKKHL